MHKQQTRRCFSARPILRGSMMPISPFVHKLSFALLSVALCPLALMASQTSGAVSAPKTGIKPQNTVKAATAATVTVSSLFYDFGNNIVGNGLTHTVTQITNGGSSALTLGPALSGNPSFSIVASQSCGTSLAAGATCGVVVTYKPGKASYPNAQNAAVLLNFGNAPADTPNSVVLTGVSARRPVGIVARTNNPQVAVYTLTLPFPGQMRVNFGQTTAYGKSTWFQSTDEENSQISIFVAGMINNKTYHMTAQVELSNGITFTDTDHTFLPTPTNLLLNMVATTEPGMTPAPGIEMVNPLNGLAAVDLEGNILWTYHSPTPNSVDLNGFKMLPNGNMLLVIGPLSSIPLEPGGVKVGLINELREINLAGDTVHEITVDDLNASLSTANCRECKGLVLQTFHHDVTPLPNGHWIVLSNELLHLSSKTSPALTNAPAQNVLGDVLIDLDENMNPVWAWREFNHLDPNRHPYSFPDWTHTNAVIYSPDDGNLLVSIRHQNWIIKVDYRNGAGAGDILWHLGAGGDFRLINGVEPTDWTYAQHGPSFFSKETSGIFSLGVMDNGDDRLYPASDKTCSPQGELPAACLYSTIPIYKINEKAKTATLTFHQKLPRTLYSFFGGITEALANGDVEYDLCGEPPQINFPSNSLVREVQQTSEAKPVWSLQYLTGNFYRAFRVPSLYPGVQWSGKVQ
jgi:arylsulfate sulfotransferase